MNLSSIKSPLQNLLRNVPYTCDEDEMDAMAKIHETPAIQEVVLRCSLNRKGINRLTPEICPKTGNQQMLDNIVGILDEAINFHQSDLIREAQTKLQHLYRLIQNVDVGKFKTPTRYVLQVLDRGKELFFEDSVSCSVKHGTIILDSSNAGAQFYASLLNILGAFATETSEFKIAKEIFSILIGLHCTSDATSRLRDMGAAYNNRGCLLLIMGEFSQAESDFKNSLKHLKCENQKQLHGSLVNAMIIAVRSNISRLDLQVRHFAKGIEEQEQLAEECKAKVGELPFQTIFMVLQNQAAMYSTLGIFPKAEKELKSLIALCKRMRREECDFLLNLVSLQLCEVLLLRGKPKEAEMVFPFEALTSVSVHDLMPTFGDLHFNVRLEAFEKMTDIFVQSGKIKLALVFLQKGMKTIKNCLGSDHVNVALLFYKEGSILKLMGKASDSMEKFKCSVRILQKIFGESHPLLIKCYMSLGDVAFQLEDADESHLCFQRAMENVEIVYQVLFLDQLCLAYRQITTRSENSRYDIFQGGKRSLIQEQMIEGLVAEYGPALAMLLSRKDSKDSGFSTRAEKKRYQHREDTNVQYSNSVLIISQKYARDLLQSGQTLLRQGMTKEAVAFFQQANTSCQAYHFLQGHPNASLVRLFRIISEMLLANYNNNNKNNALNSYLKELKEDTATNATGDESDSNSEEKEMLTFDSHLILKLVLVFLIFFSIQLKMHDTTFAAYDLYAKHLPSDDKTLLTINDELQVYASRTSVTCNGKTAVQDFLVTSTIGGSKTASECHLSRKPLFRSLAYRNNVPTYSLLATYNASVFLDIDDVKELEGKILHSLQEYLQIECIENIGKASQVVVDLTTASFWEQDILLTGRRIELLPLCLSKEAGTEDIPDEMRNVSAIFHTLCEKITCMTFDDEPTSCFMFSKIVLWLLQKCKLGKISMLRVDNQSLVLTVVDPIKARITLWYEDISIKQKVQLISTEEGRHLSDGIGRQKCSCEDSVHNPSLCCEVLERFFKPIILDCANTHEVRCETCVVGRQCFYSVEPQIFFDESCEPNGILVNGSLLKTRFSPFSCEENEEGVRKRLSASTLECLTAISEISRQLHGHQCNGDAMQGENEIVVDPNRAETENVFSLSDQDISSNQSVQDTPSSLPTRDTISSDFQQATSTHIVDTKSNDFSLPRFSCASKEANHLSLTTVKANDHDKVLGRKLFEEDRKSRSSLIAKLQEDLKKKEVLRKMNPFQDSENSSNETSGDEVSSVGELAHEAHHCEDEEQEFSICGKERAKVLEESNEEKEEHCSRSYEDPQVFVKNETPDVLQMTRGKKKRNDLMFSSTSNPMNDATLQKATNENQNDIIKTAAINILPILPKAGAANAILKEATGICEDEHQTASSNDTQIHHGKLNDLEMGHREETAQGEGVDVKNPKISPDERNRTEDNMAPKNKNISQSKLGTNLHATMDKIYTPHFQEGDDVLRDGLWDKNVRNCNGSVICLASTKISYFGELPMEDVKSDLHSHPNKCTMETSVRSPFLGGDVVADGCTTGAFSQTPQVVVDGPALLHTEKGHNKNWIETSFRSPFLWDDVVADGYTTDDVTQTTQDVVYRPAFTAENHLSGYPTIEGMNFKEGKAFKSDELQMIRNLGSKPFEDGDVVDGPIKPPNHDIKFSHISPDFGGARPKQRFSKATENSIASTSFMDPSLRSNQTFKESPLGLDPYFVARHAVVNSSPTSSFQNLNLNGATWEDPGEDAFAEHYFSAQACSGVNSRSSLYMFGEGSLRNSRKPNSSSRRFPEDTAFAAGSSIQGSVHSRIVHQTTTSKQDRSWHFPPLTANTENNAPPRNISPSHFYDNQQERATQLNLTQVHEPLFDQPMSRSAYNDMVSMTTEFNNRSGSHGETPEYSPNNNEVDLGAVIEGQQDSSSVSTESLIENLKNTMTKTVSLVASTDAAGKQPAEKVGIQEQARGEGENEHVATARERNTTEQETPLPRNERTVDMEREDRTTAVQESPRPACDHYQRRCLVKFPCCGRFYPCHRCHNESTACSDDQARAINATHIRCTICYHEQLIDEGSQKCGGCKSKMSDYFCALCKHYTSVDKNPFHCGKCGICRIHSDKSFHCDVCNVCLDRRLQGKHKCRPDSGHDECCICLEDAFSGCQILPCSHKVHKDCAIAMIQNGVRTCPICRHPLFQQPEGAQ